MPRHPSDTFVDEGSAFNSTGQPLRNQSPPQHQQQAQHQPQQLSGVEQSQAAHLAQSHPQTASTHQSSAVRSSNSTGATSRPMPLATMNLNGSPTQDNCTLWLGDLEPWMDEAYVLQVCSLMGWLNASVDIPRHIPLDTPGQHPNNPGYCLITFPNSAQAAEVLADATPNGGNPLIMPNSTRPFKMDFASSPNAIHAIQNAAQQTPEILQPIEYSIFVGDLAPEATNADLVAVFQDPRLGLRSDRVPRHIAPFKSCQSAKIMVDSTTHLSRGFGFVRFTDPADQRRALVEMQGLYCLSRPMRISAATARQKGPTVPVSQLDKARLTSPLINQFVPTSPYDQSSPTRSTQPGRSITASIANGTASVTQLLGGSPQEAHFDLPPTMAAQIASLAAVAASRSAPPPSAPPARHEEFQKWLQDHAKSILSAASPTTPAQTAADVASSSDPYNTTVFVGGLSPLISEHTLRSFFDPFGPIHYVKVPPGKNCGFVQFVNKADAEYAIQNMHGFPIAGSKIRLSWGRSHSVQAAQAQAQVTSPSLQSPYGPSPPSSGLPPNVTPEQLQLILQTLYQGGAAANGHPPSRGFGSNPQQQPHQPQPHYGQLPSPLPPLVDRPYGFGNPYSGSSGDHTHSQPSGGSIDSGVDTFQDIYPRYPSGPGGGVGDPYSARQQHHARHPYVQTNHVFSPFDGGAGRGNSPNTSRPLSNSYEGIMFDPTAAYGKVTSGRYPVYDSPVSAGGRYDSSTPGGVNGGRFDTSTPGSAGGHSHGGHGHDSRSSFGSLDLVRGLDSGRNQGSFDLVRNQDGHGAYTRTPPLSQGSTNSSSGAFSAPSNGTGAGEHDAMHDINGTLASLHLEPLHHPHQQLHLIGGGPPQQKGVAYAGYGAFPGTQPGGRAIYHGSASGQNGS